MEDIPILNDAEVIRATLKFLRGLKQSIIKKNAVKGTDILDLKTKHTVDLISTLINRLDNTHTLRLAEEYYSWDQCKKERPDLWQQN